MTAKLGGRMATLTGAWRWRRRFWDLPRKVLESGLGLLWRMEVDFAVSEAEGNW